MNCNKLTDSAEIARLAQIRFNSIYTIDNILVGDTLAMMAECRKWVVDTYHREALISFWCMDARTTEPKEELDDIFEEIKDDVYTNFDELSACMQLEKELT